MPTLEQLFFSAVLGYNLGLNTVKVGFLLLYFRLFSTTALQTASKWVLAYVLVWAVAQAILLSVACIPIATISPAMEGRCIETYTVWLTSAVVSTATDFAIFALPLPSVLRLNLGLRQKVVTAFLFSLGFLCVKAPCYPLS